MLTEYIHEHSLGIERELREIASARPRYERPAVA